MRTTVHGNSRAPARSGQTAVLNRARAPDRTDRILGLVTERFAKRRIAWLTVTAGRAMDVKRTVPSVR